MEKEDQIIEMLKRQDEVLQGHSEMLKSHSEILKSLGETQKSHSEMLKGLGETQKSHSQQLKENGQILNALRSGQEHLKAELDGFKVSTAKEFGALKKEQSNINTKLEVLHEDTWNSKLDIKRIKTTMGME